MTVTLSGQTLSTMSKLANSGYRVRPFACEMATDEGENPQKIAGSPDLAGGLLDEFVPWHTRVGFASPDFMVARRGCCCAKEALPSLSPVTHR